MPEPGGVPVAAHGVDADCERFLRATGPESGVKMRVFAVIICDECLYLEFPGCDIHGALYTERVGASASASASGDDGSCRRTSSGASAGGSTSAIASVELASGAARAGGRLGAPGTVSTSSTFTSVSTPVISIAPRSSGGSSTSTSMGSTSTSVSTSTSMGSTSASTSFPTSRGLATITRSVSVSSAAGAVSSEGSATGTSTAAAMSRGSMIGAAVAAAASTGVPLTPDTSERLQAKCPHCASATNNVRPFKDGCRRCKGSTHVFMWATTLEEISQAHESFPPLKDEVEHTVLKCEVCQSVIFPRARDALTRRTLQHLLVASNAKPLKISNFQLNMPHVDGCPRKGMPLQSVPVQLPKSELKFVQERIENCPVAPRIQGGPQYRPRKKEVITHQNHLSQIFLKLLSVIIKTFDATSPNATDPLKQVLMLFNKLKPLDLFHDWSPSRQLSVVGLKPVKVLASSELDRQYGPNRILDNDASSYWRSAELKTSNSGSGSISSSSTNANREEWLSFQFASPVAISSMVIRWHPDHLPSNVSISVSGDDITYQPVALVRDPKRECRLSFAKATAVSFVKMTMFSTDAAVHARSYGLESVLFLETGFTSLDTPTDQLLENLEQWLLKASLSSSEQVREVALQALQRLCLASGSLCGLLRLASALLFNSLEVFDSSKSDMLTYDATAWHARDQLSESSRATTREFVFQLATSISTLMNPSASSSSSRSRSNGLSGSAIEKRIIRKMSLSLQDEVTRKTIENLQHATTNNKEKVGGVTSSSSSSLSPVVSTTSTSASTPRAAEMEYAHGLHPEDLTTTIINAEELAYLASDACFSRCITRRSQLAMIILHLLSELSEWQMKRMQKAEELHSKKHDDLMQLEEPFSLEVRAACFSISHDLLRQILSPWLAHENVEAKFMSSSVTKPRNPVEFDDEQEEKEDKDQSHDTELTATANHLYQMLQTSCQEFESALLANAKDLDPSYKQPRTMFSPDKSCVAVLQIITSNIRRLVLSHVNPAEIGIDPACLHEGDSFLPAPPALAPLVSSLEQMIALGTKRSDPFFPISLEAAAAMEVGMEAFYPSAQQRTELLTSRMGKGATLEIQVRWPVQERDQEDPRYERLILMLQFECIKSGMNHAIRGSWYFFMHLVVQVPPHEDTTQLFEKIFAPCIQRAGFSCWEVVAGTQEITINLQRHLHWNRVEKMSHDSGCGWIRVYPNEVATFDEVLQDIEQFIAQHEHQQQQKAATAAVTTASGHSVQHP